MERSFEHTLDCGGGMRRTWLRGQENVEKRYLIHVAGFNLGLLMRSQYGNGTPRGVVWAMVFGVTGLSDGILVRWVMVMTTDDRTEEWKFVGGGIVRLN